MSNTQFAFLEKSRVPIRASLQASIDALGFDLQLYPALDLLSDAGFIPCVFYGVSDIGFELYSGPTSDVIGDNDELLSAIGNHDFCLNMVFHSSMKDCAAVMIVSCALAHDFGAVIFYEGETPMSLEMLLQETPEVIELAKTED
ncbi:MAG: hypothetical protein LBF16_13655 [Pseudomonadales bacterium]|jgi:hypothetical protein|nr:hypothetical protein [Pseudomonadales bacterium]